MKVLFTLVIILVVPLVPFKSTFAFEQGNMTNLNPMTGNMSVAEIGNMTANMSDFGKTGAEPSDFIDQPNLANGTCNTSDYPSTTCDVVNVLKSLTADEIHSYGLADQPDIVIKQALPLLDPRNLTKVLQNVPHEELTVIRDILTPQVFNRTLSGIPELERNQILNKLSSN
jgi:hypothetical protein